MFSPDPKPVYRGGIGRPKGKRAANDKQLREARTKVLIRAAGICEAQVPDICTRYATQAHHVLPRSRGGGHAASNLLLTCLECHAWIHAHPSISRQAGWLR